MEDEDPVVGAWGGMARKPTSADRLFAARPGGALNPLQTDDATFLAPRSATTGARLPQVGVSWCVFGMCLPNGSQCPLLGEIMKIHFEKKVG